MNYTFNEELDKLLQLVKFKGFQRYGQTLYAKYETLKPECTISEMVWGWCHNPCFAQRLITELNNKIPNFEKFTALLSRANKLVETKYLNDSFDNAMRQICTKNEPAVLTFSTESTNSKDLKVVSCDGTSYCMLNGTDEDGELWHGLLVDENIDWENIVDSVTMAIYKIENGQKELLWCNMYSQKSVMKHTKLIKDVKMFMPFKHPLILLNLDIVVECRVYFKTEVPMELFPKQVFGIVSNDFCDWLSESTFETRLAKGVKALIDVPNHTMSFCQ